jgi:hypothetical protein
VREESEMHFDDALNFIIDRLATVPGAGPGQAHARQQRAQGSDIWIDLISAEYWSAKGRSVLNLSQDDKEALVAPFYDAAWTLCRRGILRPGAAVPAGQRGQQLGQTQFAAAPFYGDGYSLTAWGRTWVRKSVSERAALPSDPNRIKEVLLNFAGKYGAGYAQRAAEAVSDWWAGNYLSACTMAGGAAESILLSTAIERIKDEGKVLSRYRAAGGRTRVIKDVISNASVELGKRFSDALGILSYWRDDASHGIASNIGEIEAHEALSRLLRLAQFTSDNWSALTVALNISLPDA